MKKWIVVGTVLLVVLGAGYYYWRGQQATKYFEQAKSAVEENDFKSARVFSEKALAIKPNHSPSLLIYAESVFKDDSIDGETRVEKSLEALGRINDESEEGLAARKREASIYFFDRLKPSKSEASLKRAIAISTDDLESQLSLMRIYCATGRETFTSPIFETMIQLAGNKSETREVLTVWFLSQFSLGSYNANTDQMLRVDSLYPLNIPISQKRLLAFRDSSPEDLIPPIALAYWFYLRADGKQAKALLDELDPEKLKLSEPLYLMTAVNIYLEMGEIEIAKDLHVYWDDQGYFEYWRQKGVLEQDYNDNKHEAINAFEKALAIWPGAIDPSIYFRLETCYRSLGDETKAGDYKKKGEEIRNNTLVDRIRELQQLLVTEELTQATCEKFVSFYKSFGREIEAQYWRALPSLSE